MGRIQQLWRYRLNALAPLFLTLTLTACTALLPTPAPSPLPTATPALPDLQSPIQRAVEYLQNEYDPAIGLVRESPVTAPDRYWLATDNWLAALALRPYDPALAEALTRTIEAYGGVEHGLIEALVGEAIEWPPHLEQKEAIGEEGVRIERRDSEEIFTDWTEYSDLALYATLNAHNQGYTEEAERLYEQALAMFDGVGFADKAWQVGGYYATYKLALALYVGEQIGEAPSEAILTALLGQQTPTGGFTALYDANGEAVNDTNTETTAYTLLALAKLATGR